MKQLRIVVILLAVMVLLAACKTKQVVYPQGWPVGEALRYRGVLAGETTVEELANLLGPADHIQQGDQQNAYFYGEDIFMTQAGESTVVMINIMEPQAEAPLGIRLGMSAEQILPLLPRSAKSLVHDVDFKTGSREPVGGQLKLAAPSLVIDRMDGEINGVTIYNGREAASLGVGFEEGAVTSILISYAGTRQKADAVAPQENNDRREPKEGLYPLAEDICFRAGEESDGELLLTADQMEGFYYTCDDDQGDSVTLVFTDEPYHYYQWI